MICCFSGGMPMPVSRHRERDDRLARWLSARDLRRSSLRCRATMLQRHAAALGELERVRQQVLEDLLQPLAHRCASSSASSGRSRYRTRASCSRPRGGTCGRRNRCRSSKRSFADIDHDRARLDLRQIENVVDQREQVVARRRGSSRANSTCFGVRLPSGFVDELIGQDEQAVERRAQLVRHVRQEFGSCTWK